jgi:hypothetical protein
MAKTRKKTRSKKTRKVHEVKLHFGVYLEWFRAVSEAQDGKLERLIKVLCTDFGTSPEVHAAELEGRKMLAAWLERRRTRKKGGQRKPIFNLSAPDRRDRLADVVRRMQAGEISHITDLVEGQRRVVLTKPLLKSFEPKRRSRAEAIDKLAVGKTHEEAHKDATALHNHMTGKIGYGRGRKLKGKPELRELHGHEENLHYAIGMRLYVLKQRKPPGVSWAAYLRELNLPWSSRRADEYIRVFKGKARFPL